MYVVLLLRQFPSLVLGELLLSLHLQFFKSGVSWVPPRSMATRGTDILSQVVLQTTCGRREGLEVMCKYL